MKLLVLSVGTNALSSCTTRVIQPGWLAFLMGKKSVVVSPSVLPHIFVPSSTDVLYTGLNGGHSSNWKKVPLPLALLVVFSSVLLLIHRYDSFFFFSRCKRIFSLQLSSHFCPAEIVRSWGTHRKDCEEFASLFSMLSIVENRETISMSLQSSVVFGCVPVSSDKTEERISVKSTVLGSREQKIGHK